jgi:hypothetical protein
MEKGYILFNSVFFAEYNETVKGKVVVFEDDGSLFELKCYKTKEEAINRIDKFFEVEGGHEEVPEDEVRKIDIGYGDKVVYTKSGKVGNVAYTFYVVEIDLD